MLCFSCSLWSSPPLLFRMQSLLVRLSEHLNAFLVNYFLREQSGFFHYSEELLSGEVIKVDAVQDDLPILSLAIFILEIPSLEKMEFGLGGRGLPLFHRGISWCGNT